MPAQATATTREGLLGEIIEVPTRKDASRALEVFREEYGAKYPKALAKLDRDVHSAQTWAPRMRNRRLKQSFH